MACLLLRSSKAGGVKTGVMNFEAADLEPELVEGLRQAGFACDLIHKLATGCIFKDDATCVLAQSEGQEGSLEGLLCIGLDAHPLPINAKGLGEGSAL